MCCCSIEFVVGGVAVNVVGDDVVAAAVSSVA